ncbi:MULTISPECIES: TonB-dependent receptor domain-containing protein [Gammaproteobacteria]|uniref:TonB-dependent receptor domain-containing protein n=1 Tax=Gammaproteobacteria TaxID=1236 RepID=UPI001A9E7149|nr:TonB-dependent receptor [Aliidiomarina sp. B3213]
MKQRRMILRPLARSILIALATAPLMSQPLWAETTDVEAEAAAEEAEEQVIDEVLREQRVERIQVTGRQMSSAAVVAAERREQPQVADYLDSVSIGRIGDSDVASALRRITGLTLVDNKFIYVRGLGERYSSTLLNGGMVPSPDPTRNVIPLDMFPTSIIESLVVQKSFSVSEPASFGGGGVNIRTLNLPQERFFEFSLSTGMNSENSDDGLTYAGGDDDWRGRDDGTRGLAPELTNALNQYGSLEPISIAQALGGVTVENLEQAQAINRDLGLAINRNMDVTEQSIDPDYGASFSYGDRFELSDSLSLGLMSAVSYDQSAKNINEQERYYSITTGNELTPLVAFDDISGTEYNTQLSGIFNVGLNYNNEHKLETTTVYLLDTADEIKKKVGDTIETINESNRENVDYSIRYEERTLVANQIRGSHVFGFLGDMSIDWQYTDAKARRYAPGEVEYRYLRNRGEDGSVTEALRRSDNAALYLFSDMVDNTENGRIDFGLPVSLSNWELELQGGYFYYQRSRNSEVNRFKLDSRGFSNQELAQSFSNIFSDENIQDPNRNFRISDVTAQADDYIAAQQLDAFYVGVDALWDYTWRVNVGARYEDFRQLALPMNPATGEIQGEIADYPLLDDDLYPSIAVTWLFHPDMQLRFGASETVVRPDLREVTPVLYVDPLTDFKVIGYSDLISSKLTNFDVRWEWYMYTGGSLSVGGFYKDIDAPIETIELLGSDGNLLVSFRNAETGYVYGLETEFVKPFEGALEGFFVAGNVTLSDSEIEIQSFGESNITNLTRRMSGHSEYVLNTQLGFDSANEKHSATLSYNVFGERISFAGVDGKDDAYEQPFHSVDFTYSYYPVDGMTFKVGAKNLLGESVEITQQGEILQRREPGTSLSASFTYRF